MKTFKLITVICVLLSSIVGMVGSAIWATLSFIIFLAKDKDFDFKSIWLLITSVVVYVIASVVMSVIKIRQDEKAEAIKKQFILDDSEKIIDGQKMSSFQRRLKEMSEKQKVQ